jgi:hypothetical protein
MNILFYRSSNRSIQSAEYISFISQSHCCEPDRVDRSCSLGLAMTWIMSQRIILHLRGKYPTMPRPGPLIQWNVQRLERNDRLLS